MTKRITLPRALCATALAPRGFSLPELLVVVGILGLVVTLAVPSLRAPSQRHSLRQETLNVQRMLEFAHTEAVASRATVVVELDLQVFPVSDSIRVLENAQWNPMLATWEGTEVTGGMARVVEPPLDVQELRVGPVTHFSGLHAIVFTPTGPAGLDDGSVLGPVELDIVHMDASA